LVDNHNGHATESHPDSNNAVPPPPINKHYARASENLIKVLTEMCNKDLAEAERNLAHYNQLHVSAEAKRKATLKKYRQAKKARKKRQETLCNLEDNKEGLKRSFREMKDLFGDDRRPDFLYEEEITGLSGLQDMKTVAQFALQEANQAVENIKEDYSTLHKQQDILHHKLAECKREQCRQHAVLEACKSIISLLETGVEKIAEWDSFR
jgi:flagellar motility protein MotE (MotC chaperone)